MNIIRNTFSVSPVRFTVGEIGRNIADNSKGVAKGITMAGYAAGAGMGL